MNINEKVKTDIELAAKAGDENRLKTLLMVKSSLRSKEIDKGELLTDAEETQILTTLIRQWKVSAESHRMGGEPERMREIEVIEAYLPQAARDEEIRKLVNGAIAHLQKDAGGIKPGPKDMDTAIQVAQQWIRAAGLQADRETVSEIVKAELGK
jgi:hypothetical protein